MGKKGKAGGEGRGFKKKGKKSFGESKEGGDRGQGSPHGPQELSELSFEKRRSRFDDLGRSKGEDFKGTEMKSDKRTLRKKNHPEGLD